MRVKKSIYTNNREEIIQFVKPFIEMSNSNKERFKKVLKVRNCEFNDEGYVQWSYSLLSSNPKVPDKDTERKLEEMDLMKKCEKFMDGVNQVPAVYCVEIRELCDGFQLDLSARKTSFKKGDKGDLLDSATYFVWRAY